MTGVLESIARLLGLGPNAGPYYDTEPTPMRPDQSYVTSASKSDRQTGKRKAYPMAPPRTVADYVKKKKAKPVTPRYIDEYGSMPRPERTVGEMVDNLRASRASAAVDSSGQRRLNDQMDRVGAWILNKGWKKGPPGP